MKELSKEILNTYNLWRTDERFDKETRDELNKEMSNEEIEDRFWRDLEFGTGGLRGVMGTGTNRMNKYIIRKATKGFANYLLNKYGADVKRGVAIGYDSRNNSDTFAREASLVMCASGIPTFLFDYLVPTPTLSFTVRELGCVGGIVVTASHNPREYNGYKVYDSDGCQVLIEDANAIIEYVNAITDIPAIEVANEEDARASGLLKSVDDSIYTKFCESVKKQAHDVGEKSAKIVYTPLHGTGNVPVRRVLSELGYNVTVVDAQVEKNGDFPTVVSPNPENAEALSMGIKLCEEIGADLILGTDPDCDRVGIAVNTKDGMKLFTGNQVGALLVDYVIKMNKSSLNEKSTVIKTIVTSELGAIIAKQNGLKVIETLTGFKFIGDKMNEFDKTGNGEFVIGYEESYGYLVGTHARDKDAVVASMLICEMACYYKNQGKTLVDVMEEIYATYGYFLDKLDSYTLKGIDGVEKIQGIMKEMREKGKSLMPNIAVVNDYTIGIDDLPKADVLKFVFEDSSWIAIRPSGTEPKIKVYYSVKGENKADAEKVLESRRAVINQIIGE
ncbi:MAG: phospho-sugar mutase [Ruminococcaceae bacterium]|nr:phospho-sugar mutase [Oscillospiraceae bacterium]